MACIALYLRFTAQAGSQGVGDAEYIIVPPVRDVAGMILSRLHDDTKAPRKFIKTTGPTPDDPEYISQGLFSAFAAATPFADTLKAVFGDLGTLVWENEEVPFLFEMTDEDYAAVQYDEYPEAMMGRIAATREFVPTDEASLGADNATLDSLTAEFHNGANNYADKLNAAENFHDGLAVLILSVITAPINSEVYDYAESQIPPGGTVHLASVDITETDEPEEEDDGEWEFTRPNGEIYYARLWSGIKDVEVLRRAQTHGYFPLLKGNPGTGKTALVDSAFPDLITVVLSGDSEVRDLVGDYAPNPNGASDEPDYIWVDGPLIQAMLEGRPLLLDEVGLMDPKVGSILYGVMDGRGELVVTMNQSRGIIKSAPGFFIIGATNPNAPGVQMSEALLSRFTLQADVTTDWPLAIRVGVEKKMVATAQKLSGLMDEHTISWSPQFRELKAYRDVSEVYGAAFALSNLLAQCPEHDLAAVLEVVKRTHPGASEAAKI